MIPLKVMMSAEDSSVNMVFPAEQGYLEARRVNRAGRLVVYLSSQSGCNQGCRMCHLTTTGQRNLVDATKDQILGQARAILRHYDQYTSDVQAVHFNFMARGEPLANPHLLREGHGILACLAHEAMHRNLLPRYLISTIMPANMAGKRLIESFRVVHPDIYYSIYSVRENFRRKWLPRALPVRQALDILADYYDMTSKVPKLHWAFIKGENDSVRDVQALCQMVNTSKLKVDVNIVRYNPYSEKFGSESSEEVIARNVGIIQEMMPLAQIEIVTRVGQDVKASCGMFIEPDGVSA